MLGDLPPSAVESNMTAADNGPDAHDGSSPKAKESRKERKLREKKEHAAAAQPPVFREGRQQLNDIDDFSSAWQECKESGLRWGGRGRGGRGIGRQYMGNSTALRDICVDGVTLAYDGKELLQRTLLRITEGHRYALLGRTEWERQRCSGGWRQGIFRASRSISPLHMSRRSFRLRPLR